MAADFNKPAVSDNYSTGYTAAINDNIAALAKLLDPAKVTPANIPSDAICWRSANSRFEIRSGGSWVELCASYAINISGTAANVTGTVLVAKGGTGAVSFTDGGLLVGNGTDAIGIATAAEIVAAIGSTAVADSSALGGVAAASYAKIGKQTIWIPAGAMIPRITAGPQLGLSETSTYKVMASTLDFDQTTPEYAQFQVAMPKSWNESTLTAKFVWSSAIAGTNAVAWDLQAVAITNDDPLDVAFGSAVEVIDAQTATGDLMHTDATAAMTVGGSITAEDVVIFQVYRNAASGSDTLAGDARLHGIAIYYTTDGQNDA